MTTGDPAGNRGGLGRTGEYYDNYITAAQVSSSTFGRAGSTTGKTFAYQVDGPVYAQPLVIPNVPITDQSGHQTDYNKNVLLVATTHNQLYAFDADRFIDSRTGAPALLWHDTPDNMGWGQPVAIGGRASSCGGNSGINGNPIACKNVSFTGLLSTPYVDTTNMVAYMVVASLPSGIAEDAQAYDAGNPPTYTLWAIDLKSGKPLSSVVLSGSSLGVNFNAFYQIQRVGLTPVTAGGRTFLLIAFSSSCDCFTPYYGWALTQEITDASALGAGASGVFCATCAVPPASGGGGGIWQSGAGIAVDNANSAYFLSGNGNGYGGGDNYFPGDSGTFSNTAFRVTVDGGVPTLQDYFTPADQLHMSLTDLDFSSSGIAWLGGDGGGPNVLLAGSKSGVLYLMDPTKMGGYSQNGDNILGRIQGSCDQFDPACPPTYPAVTQPWNCQAGVIQPDEAGFSSCHPNGGLGNGYFPRLHEPPVYWAEHNYAYIMGQADYLRRVKLTSGPPYIFDTDSGDSFAFADAAQIAPTGGTSWSEGAMMSLSYNPVDSNHDGVLWVSLRVAKEQQDWTLDAGSYTANHSDGELEPGAFYAVNATTMTRLYQDPSPGTWLMSKFTAPTIYNGRVYLATMSNEVLVYCNDQDSDGVCDTMDNCPTVANTDQANSNEDAERLIPGTPILGDACDPNASTSFTVPPPNIGIVNPLLDRATDGVQVPCEQIIYLSSCGGGSSSSWVNCPRIFNTNLPFNAHIGNDAGAAPNASGTTGPAFCACPAPLTQYQCLQPGLNHCAGANDSQFPPLDGGSPPPGSNWNAMTRLLAPDGSASWYTPISLTHVEPKNAFNAPDAASWVLQAWDFPTDVSRFGGANSDAGVCDAASCALQGELWAHVMGFTPNGTTENGITTNLNNSYINQTAQFLNTALPPRFGSPTPCLKPVYQPWRWVEAWSPDPVWMFPFSSGVIVQGQSYAADVTTGFTSNALSVLEPLTGGATSTFMVAADGARTLGTSQVLAALVTSNGNGGITLSDALVSNGTQVDAIAAVSGAVNNTVANAVAEALDPESGKLYVLTQNGAAQSLVSMDAMGALNNFIYAQTSFTVSGATLGTALAMQYSDANSELFLLDRVANGDVYQLRLSTLSTAGVMTELWRTTGVALSQFPSAFLSTDAFGSVVVSLQVGTTTAEAMIVNASGTPTGSYDLAGSMSTRALTGSGGGLWFGLDSFNGNNYQLAPTFQAWPVTSICGASWLKGHAGASGALHNATSNCNAITNGGFETGDFSDWTTSGAATNVTTGSAHSGYFGTMLGSTTPTNGDSTVQQTFAVPSGGGTLNIWWSNTCPDTVTYDWFTATLQNTSGRTLATIVAKTCTATPTWTHSTLNLSSWAGQTVVVVLTSHDDNYPGDPTYSYVDDISVQ